MNIRSTVPSPRSRTMRRAILLTSISTILSTQGMAADAVFSSGAFTGDADSGLSSTKSYVALGNIVGGDVTVNGVTLTGTGLSGTGWSLTGAGSQFPTGAGGDHTGFLGQAITGLFDGFQYGGNPGNLNISGLTAGQTYTVTLYNQAWGLGDNRTQTVTSSEGERVVYNEDALVASTLRYTFVATGGATDLRFLPQVPGNTMHFYGLSNEQVFNNTWSPTVDNSWNTAGNWSTGVVPNVAGSNATFSPQAGPTTVTLAAATTTGHIEFQGTGSYNLLGLDPLTLQSDSGGVSVIKANAGGSHTINAPIALGSDLVKFGAGTITLGGGVSGAKAVNVSNGTLKFAATNSYTGGTSVGTGATLDFNGTSQSLGALRGAGTLANTGGGTSTATVDSGAFSGTIATGVAVTKASAGVLALSGSSTSTEATTINAGTLRLETGSQPLITDNFSTTGTPDTNNLNFNLANRQTGTAALQNWTGAGNVQTGNTTPVTQPTGVNGDYLLLAFGGSATLAGMPLDSANAPGPVKINFDMFKGNSGDASEWTSFTLRSAPNLGFPIAGSGEVGMLYRRNTGIQIFSNGGLVQDFASTSGGDSFGFYLADSAGTGSPFAGNGTKLVVTQGGGIISSFALNTGMGSRYVTFGSAGGMIGGVDNVAVNNFKTNVLSTSTAVSLANAGAKLELDGVHQTVASLNGVAGTEVAMGPFSRLAVNGGGTFNGIITGATATFAKSGSAPLFLSAANTYGGGTDIQGGPIFAYNVSALGSGTVNIGAGGNYLPWFNSGSPVIRNNFTLNGLGGNAGDGLKAAIYADGGGGGYGEYQLTGNVALNATSDISGHNTNNLRVLGPITGPGGLTKGSGRVDENNAVILNNQANSYSGDTTVANGTLRLGASEVIPHGAGKGRVIVNAGATFDLAGNNETINNLSGAGSVTSSAGVAIGAPVFFSTNADSGIATTKTYTHVLDFGDGTAATVNSVTFTEAGASGANWNLTGAGALLPEGAGAASSPTFGDAANGTGMNQLLSDFFFNGNPATLTLSGLNPGTNYETRLYNRVWGGDRTQLFQVNAGGATGALLFNQDGNATPSYLSFRYTADASGTASISTFQIGTGTYHWYGVTNEVVTAPTAPVLTVGDNTDSTFSGAISSALALSKQGSGTLTLSGANSYTGATTINGGKLLVNGSLSGTSSVAISSGILGGSGSINAAALVSVAGGAEISPGNSIGTLSLGSVAFADSSTFSIELGTTTGDQLVLAGGGTISGTVNLALSLLADPVDGTLFTLIDGTSPFTGYAGGARFSYLGNPLDDGELFSVTSGAFTQDLMISYAGDGGNDVTLQAVVPEPGSAALLLLGGVALLRRRRRE
jgi:autotransporter-associated beta strand protein